MKPVIHHHPITGKPITRQMAYYYRHQNEVKGKRKARSVKKNHPWKGDIPVKNIPVPRDPIEIMLDKMERDRMG